MLILLFADRRGDLRVVLTVRSHLLRTFAGHVALPGGRADFLTETPFDTARREAFEEIGLPLESEQFPPPFSVEHLTELPCSLARTALGVRPCVAFLKDGSAALQGTDVEDNLIPRLEENEVASIFTVPLERFMSRRYTPLPGATEADENWYSGSWIKWNGTSWRAHEFQAPVWEKTTLRKYRVWGMTGRIMVDVARIAYGRDPDFAHNEEFGDEHMVRELHARGEMGEEAARKKDKGLAKREEVEVKKGNL